MAELALRYSLDYAAFVIAAATASIVILIWLRRRDGGPHAHRHVLILLPIILLVGWFFVSLAGDRERNRLRTQIEGLAPTYAEELQEMGHADITLETDPNDPTYLAMIEKQRRWLAINHAVSDIYTFRDHEKGNQLIVDSETDYDRDGKFTGDRESRTEIGEIWQEESPFLVRAHAGETCFDDSPYSDRWGTWVSAYVPMYDKDNRVEAVLGVDFPAHDWVSSILRARLTWIGMLAILVTIGLSSTSVIALLRISIQEKDTNQQALQAEQLLLRRMIDIQEGERRMVAHDIHDGFVQDVVGAHMHLQRIDSTETPESNEQLAARVGKLLEKAIAEGRRLIRDTRPMVLDEAGVVEAIRHLLSEENASGEIVVAFDHEVQFERLDPQLEGVIFRIVQEAITNVRRHAKTDHAAVQIKQSNGRLHVSVRDQGVGFDPDAIPRDRFGVRGIRERARLFGGDAEIISRPGKGTTIRVSLPIQIEA